MDSTSSMAEFNSKDQPVSFSSDPEKIHGPSLFLNHGNSTLKSGNSTLKSGNSTIKSGSDFSGNQNLPEVYIDNSFTSISDSTFKRVPPVDKITIPCRIASVDDVGDDEVVSDDADDGVDLGGDYSDSNDSNHASVSTDGVCSKSDSLCPEAESDSADSADVYHRAASADSAASADIHDVYHRAASADSAASADITDVFHRATSADSAASADITDVFHRAASDDSAASADITDVFHRAAGDVSAASADSADGFHRRAVSAVSSFNSSECYDSSSSDGAVLDFNSDGDGYSSPPPTTPPPSLPPTTTSPTLVPPTTTLPPTTPPLSLPPTTIPPPLPPRPTIPPPPPPTTTLSLPPTTTPPPPPTIAAFTSIITSSDVTNTQQNAVNRVNNDINRKGVDNGGSRPIRTSSESFNKIQRSNVNGSSSNNAHAVDIGREVTDTNKKNKTNVIPFDINAAKLLNDSNDDRSFYNEDVNHFNGNGTGNKGNGNSNKGIDDSTNSTNAQDNSSKYFTIVTDLPKEGPGKKCPKVPLGGLFQWCKVKEKVLLDGLSPRARHWLRVALIVLGSALLLVAIFLLARLPHAHLLPDVMQPALYDLPSDDAFRPGVADRHVYDLQHLDSYDAPPFLAVDHPDVVGGLDVVRGPDVIPMPGPVGDLRALARRQGVGFHPELGVPVDASFLKMEEARKQRLAHVRSHDVNGSDVERVLDYVRNTVDTERKEMKDKERKLWTTGETPLRILLVSTWRSGSTFLGQVLQQHPGVFQHYEPFSYLGVKQIRSGTEAFQAQQLLHRLMKCSFSGQDEYLNYCRKHPVDMIGHNKRIWKACNTFHRVDVCSNATFLADACNMFPIQLVKTVRLRLNLTQLFLGETRLNAKVVFLVRDPRATISSRRSSVTWCDSSHDCSSPEVLCSDLREDLKVSAALERLYPKSFIMVRYEDLANEPQDVIKKLIEFLGMEYTSDLEEFVAQHTESDQHQPWSIARKSAARVSRWKEQLSRKEIDDIQKTCTSVIERLGYEFDERK